MRILQLTHKPPYPPNDGSSIAIYNMSCGLIENEVELTLLTINTKKHFKADETVNENFKRNSNYQSVFRDTDTTATGALKNLFTSQSYFVSRFYFKEFEEKIITILQQNEFDVVQLESIFLGDYIPAIRKYSHAKIALRTHNVEHLIWERLTANEPNFLKKSYLKLQTRRLKVFEKKVLLAADAIVPITAVDGEYFLHWNIQKPYHVSPTGLQLKDYNVDASHVMPLSIFHFGSMDWLPNEEAVLWFIENVWEKILSEIPQAKFYIVGRGMSKKISCLQKPNVIVVGKTETAGKVYKQYDVMVVPLLSGSGMRIKMIEGMAYGKPIVSTTIGAEGIPVSDGINSLLKDTPEDFAIAITGLLKNPGQKENLQKNARIFVEEYFDNTAIVGDLVRFYRDLL